MQAIKHFDKIWNSFCVDISVLVVCDLGQSGTRDRGKRIGSTKLYET